MDIDAYRISTALPSSAGSVSTPKKGRPTRAAFLAGPVPMWWLARAYKVGAAAQAVGLALWHARRMKRDRSEPIKANSAVRRSMGLSQDQARRGLKALAEAGLVEFHRGGRGRCAEVTLVTDAPPTSPPLPTETGEPQ